MAVPKKSLYDELFKAFKAAHPLKLHSALDVEVSKLWKSLQTGEKTNFHAKVRDQIIKLESEASTSKASLISFWAKIPKKSVLKKPEAIAAPLTETCAPPIIADSLLVNKTPVQDALKKEILALTQEIQYLEQKKESGMATEKQIRDLVVFKASLKETQRRLTALEGNRQRQKKKREKDKMLLQELEEEHPEAAIKLKRRRSVGRPRLEDVQPDLLNAIVNIAIYGSSADERRRSEKIRSVKSLDQLTEELRLQGFQLSRSGLYLRLLPSNSRTLEGKRHVRTVPVKLFRASNDQHKSHVDSGFCQASIGYLEELASILGPKDVIFLSQDDKARVPLGITAANKQSPLLMHMDYRVKLPDHDWIVAERHKLIPSVYAIMKVEANQIGNKKAVGYTGPTHVAIRSAKHCSSTAVTHGKDLDAMLNNDEFAEFCKIDDLVKPVLIIITDGGPDENPRYHKVMEVAISHFKTYNLDGIFLATNAPGRSAYNRVERRMAPLSRELAGVILPHDHFGSHLDDKNKTIDEKLEKSNFEHAGNVLAEIWSKMIFDGYPTSCSYVRPTACEEVLETSAAWKQKHVREGHYFFQVIKCNDRTCCSEPRGSLHKVINGFIPAPLCVTQNDGLRIHGNDDDTNDFCSLLYRLKVDDSFLRNNGFELPFDFSCPSLKGILDSRICKLCGSYHSSLKTLKAHKKICQSGTQSAPTDNLCSLLGERRRPVRVAARRLQEKMIIWSSRLNGDHADWFDNEDLNNLDIEEPADVVDESYPVIDYTMYNSNAWETV